MLLNFSKLWINFPSKKYLNFLDQQTYAFRFESAFQLFDKTLCTKINELIQSIQMCFTVLILRE